jgi:glycosyltransferase involved in cell wall biosynthesis
MLGKFNLPLRWVHFGAGKDLEKVRELVKGFEHVQAEFPGHVSNADLISFYQNNAVHAFVHMSETEGGIPVSIQEAVSFGIPIIAANAGGVPEIVNAQTGVLLSHAFDAQAAVNALSMIIETMSCDARKRESIRNVWKLHFDAQKKYTDFAEHLIHE